MKQAPSQEAIRQLAWDVGTKFPPEPRGTYVALATNQPGAGYLRWNAPPERVSELLERLARGPEGLHGSTLVVRVHDVTDVDFDGTNAHHFFDVDTGGSLVGKHYFHLGQLERHLLAELGFRMPSGEFHALARSNTRYFDRGKSSGNFQLGGLFVGPGFRRVFPVECVFDAPAYEKLADGTIPEDAKELQVAVVVNGFGAGLRPAIERLGRRLADFKITVSLFGSDLPQELGPVRTAEAQSWEAFRALRSAHEELAFDLVHCHDWYSAEVGMRAQEELGVPFLLSLHSTEHERARGGFDERSRQIADLERLGAQRAARVVVPHSSTRSQLIDLYSVDPERVVIVSDDYQDLDSVIPDPSEAKRRLHLDPSWPVGIFAGEVSHATGADLLVGGIFQVAGEFPSAHFLIVGEGPLKGELEGRVWGGGLGGRVRFLGDVPGEHFEAVLMAADFAVIPARSFQHEGFARHAISLGKPVLTTHQAGIHCVRHGENGVVTYDNPGSIIWGLKEMLGNPMGSRMLQSVARRLAEQGQSLDGIAVEHFVAYHHTVGAAAAGRPRSDTRPSGAPRSVTTTAPEPPKKSF